MTKTDETLENLPAFIAIRDEFRKTVTAKVRELSDEELLLQLRAMTEMFDVYSDELKRRQPVLADPAGSA